MNRFLHDFTAFSWSWLDWRSVLLGLGVMSVIAYGRRSLGKLIVRWGTTVINGFLWIAERFVSRSVRAQLSMRRYCRNRLSVEGTRLLHVPGRRDAALDVDDVFVPLMLEQDATGDPLSSSDLPDVASRLIVVGDPGSGKSTLVKRLYRDSCRTTAKKPRNGKLPILIELRSLEPPAKLHGDGAAGEWLLSVLKDHVGQVEGFEMDQLFASWSTNAGLIVLLDGLDEVGSDRYPMIASALRGLSRRLAAMSAHNTIIVTMRIQFHQQVGGQFLDDYPKTLYVSPFSPNEIYLFLTKWPFKRDRLESIKKVYAELADRPTLREMCQNPLVLAMYVQNSLESGVGELPSTRTEFYEKVVTELLVKRRARQDMSSRTSSALREQRESLLGQLAFENMTDAGRPVNSLPWKRASELAQKIWKCSADQAEVRLLGLASETGVIEEEKPGETFRFIHQTFCEFLAATECAKRRKDGWRDLMATHHSFIRSDEAWLQTRLLEVLPFAHALLPQHARAEALTNLAELGDGLILGRCFLETQLYDRPEWRDYVEGEREILSKQAADRWDEFMLRRLQLLSVVTRDSRDWAADTRMTVLAPDLRDMFSSIASDNTKLVAAIFGTYVRQDAAAALRLADEMGIDLLAERLGVAIEACQEAPFLDLMLDRMVSDGSRRTSLVLLEAALRYQSVAVALDALEPPIASPRGGSPMDMLVRACHIRLGSVYASIARAASQAPASERADFPATEIFTSCARRARGFFMINSLAPIIPLIIFLSIFFLPGTPFGLNGPHAKASGESMIELGIVVLAVIIGFVIMTFIFPFVDCRTAIYREMGNVHPSAEDELGIMFLPIFRRPIRVLQREEVEALQRLTSLRPDSASAVLKAMKAVAPQ